MIAAGLCLVGAVAYACTTGQTAQTTVSPNTGTANSPLTVQTGTTGGGLAAGSYNFRYDNVPLSSQGCHHEASIGAVVSPDGTGNIPTQPRDISNLGPKGNANACWSVTNSKYTNQIAKSAPITVN